MAKPEHLSILKKALTKQDISIWNKWRDEQRQENHKFSPELGEANLTRSNLTNADLSNANLYRAHLFGANLVGANLVGADMREANLSATKLSAANLRRADLRWANLGKANLRDANLTVANLTNADLDNTDLTNSTAGYTLFAEVNLATVHGLPSVQHDSPSTIGIDTLYRSGGNIPEIFLCGAGVPDTMIAFAKSLVGKAIEYYSAFISYSDKDKLFARRLHNDLQMNGVRVWFAPEDLKIGDPLKQTIDESIKLYDKLILVLSENSINRAWVHHEVARALEKEKQHNKLVLFPLRLDDTVFTTTEQWAYNIRERYIGDFNNWTNPLLYQNAINRLLRDLNAKS